MDHWTTQQFSVLSALLIESEIDSTKFHNLKNLTERYGIALNFGDFDTILRQSWPRSFVEHPSISRKDEYRLHPEKIELVKAQILRSMEGHLFFVSPSSKTVVTDSSLPKLLTLPHGWKFGEVESSLTEVTQWSQITDLIKAADENRDSMISIEKDDPRFENAIQSLETVTTTILQSNSASDFLQTEIAPQLSAALEILKSAKKVTIGLIEYLILDRLKEAYKDASEDFLKDMIKFSFFAVALYFLGHIK